MLAKVDRANGPSCRPAGAVDLRAQYGDDHQRKKNGNVSLKEALNDRISANKSHGSTLVV
jgi:hypothetical protein